MASPKQVGDWLSAIAGQTGVNSVWLKRAADAGVISPGMTPDQVYRAVSNMAVPPAPRQMSLPMGDPADEIRALIPYGSTGPGVPTAMSAPGVPVEIAGDLIEAPLRGLPAPQQARLGTTAAIPSGAPQGAPGLPAPPQRRLTYNPVETAARSMDGGVPAGPDFDLGSPLWDQMNRSSRAYDNIRTARTANLRNQTPDFVRIAQQNINEANQAAASARQAGRGMSDASKAGLAAAGTGALAAGVYSLAPEATPTPSAEAPAPSPKPSTTADLAEESRPAPKVAATDKDGVPLDEQKFTEMFKRQYLAREEKRKTRGEGPYAPKPAPAAAPAASPSAQAKAILADLNERRRKAGGEVPEAKQMMDQANRLLAQGNQQRNAPGYKPAPMSNPREQAQALLQKLNADRMAAGGEVPHSQKVLAEVRRLQAMADEQDWRR